MPLPKHFEEEKDQVQKTYTDDSMYEELSDEDLTDMESVSDEEPFNPVEEDEDESEDRAAEDEPTFADYEDDEDEEEDSNEDRPKKDIKKPPVKFLLVVFVLVAVLLGGITFLRGHPKISLPQAKKTDQTKEKASDSILVYSTTYPKVTITAKESISGKLYLVYQSGKDFSVCYTNDDSYSKGQKKETDLLCDGKDIYKEVNIVNSYFVKE